MCVLGFGVGVGGGVGRRSKVKHSLEERIEAHANLYGRVQNATRAGRRELAPNLSFMLDASIFINVSVCFCPTLSVSLSICLPP